MLRGITSITFFYEMLLFEVLLLSQVLSINIKQIVANNFWEKTVTSNTSISNVENGDYESLVSKVILSRKRLSRI